MHKNPGVLAPLTDVLASLQTDPTNAPFQTDMDDWAAISNRTYIWNYVTSFGSYIQPFPDWYVLGPNIKYFADHGVRGIFEEGSYGTSGGEPPRYRAGIWLAFFSRRQRYGCGQATWTC